MQLYPAFEDLVNAGSTGLVKLNQLKGTARQAIKSVQPKAVKQELQKSAENFHVIGAWVAIIFRPYIWDH